MHLKGADWVLQLENIAEKIADLANDPLKATQTALTLESIARVVLTRVPLAKNGTLRIVDRTTKKVIKEFSADEARFLQTYDAISRSKILNGWKPSRQQWLKAENELKNMTVSGKLVRDADDQIDRIKGGLNWHACFNNETGEILARKDASYYVIFHELTHARHMDRIGQKAYQKLTPYEKELYVYKQIMHNRALFNEEELKDALRIIRDYAQSAGLKGP